MLVDCGALDPGLASGFIDVGEEFCLLVVVVLVNTVVPGYVVTYKVQLVCVGRRAGIFYSARATRSASYSGVCICRRHSGNLQFAWVYWRWKISQVLFYQ